MALIPAGGPMPRFTAQNLSDANPDPIERHTMGAHYLDEPRARLRDAGSSNVGLDETAVLAGLVAVLGEIGRRGGGSVVVMHQVPVDAMCRPIGPPVEPS